MAKVLASAGLVAVMVAGMAVAQQRERLPANCREEIRVLCQQGGGMRECVRGILPKLSQECRTAISDRSAARATRPEGVVELAYGSDPKQKLDFERAASPGGKAPLLVFVHGGAWAIGDKTQSLGAKAGHFTAQGWAFASVNYRLVPGATVEQQAGDVAAAVAWLRANAMANGIDPERIVVMGHSAGAHLAALVSSDPSYLVAAGVPFAAVRGAILLDGAAYDVAAQLTAPQNKVADMYQAAFGTDPKRQARLSPMAHTAAPNVPRWLVLAIDQRAESTDQSRALADALAKAGAQTRFVAVPGSSHRQLNQGLGTEGDFGTGEVDRFLAALR